MTLTEFLEPFYPDMDEPIWILGFPPKGMPENHPHAHDQRKRQITRGTLSTNRLLQDNLKADNQTMGLYFVVNAGGTEKTDIKRINAIYCEIDEIPIEDQHRLYDNCELKPSIRIETQKSIHAYWLPEEKLTVAQFTNLQQGLIKRFQSDPKIKNENRVMRLPFFNHLSWAEEYVPKRVQIHTFQPQRFSLADLSRSFPFTAPKAEKPRYIDRGNENDNWASIQQELRFRISCHPTYRVEANRTWATCKGICHDGKNNTAITVNLRTGAVSCKAGCNYERILNVFGLYKPIRETGIVRTSARTQKSKLYEFLKENER
jgi:hypothetical protein